MRFSLFFCFYLILNNAHSQYLQDITALDTVIYFNNFSGSTSRVQFTCALDYADGNCFILAAHNAGSTGTRTFSLIRVNMSTLKVDSFLLGTFSQVVGPGELDIAYFSCNGRYCAMRIGKKDLVYAFNEGKWQLYDSPVLNAHYNKSRWVGNNILIGKFLHLVDSRDDKKVRVLRYSTEKKKVMNESFPEFDGIQFSLFYPYQWIDSYGKQAVIAQTVHYSFSVYDEELKKISTITHPKKNWKNFDEVYFSLTNQKYLPVFDPQVINTINQLTPYEDSLINRIDGVFFTDPNTILVRYTLHEKDHDHWVKKRAIDIWKKRGKDWELFKEGLADFYAPPSSAQISKEDYPLLTYNGSDVVCIKQNRIMLATYEAPFNAIGKSWSEGLKQKFEYNKDHPHVLALYIYKINTD